jgi:flagellar protein FlaG
LVAALLTYRDTMILEANKVNPGASTAPGGSAPPAPLTAAARVVDASVDAHATPSSDEGLREVVAAADRAVKSLHNAVQLSLDSHSGQPIVRVVDTETGQLIRQIPTEEVLELRRALDRIAGLLIQRTA